MIDRLLGFGMTVVTTNWLMQWEHVIFFWMKRLSVICALCCGVVCPATLCCFAVSV